MRLKHELFTNNCNFKKFDNHLKLLYNIENKKEVNQMILVCDIGNSTIGLCTYDKDKATGKFELSTDRSKSADEYSILIENLFRMKGISKEDINGAVIGSVVPEINTALSRAISSLFGVKPITVGVGIKTSLDIKTDRPSEVGADIVANCVSALSEYEPPLIIVDFATSTTIVTIDKTKRLTDVFILPGVYSSYSAITRDAAEIASVPLFTPMSLSGKNTAASVNAGVVYGAAFALDGFIKKIKNNLSLNDVTVLATGGGAPLVTPLCEEKIIRKPNLTCDGLYQIYLKNCAN